MKQYLNIGLAAALALLIGNSEIRAVADPATADASVRTVATGFEDPEGPSLSADGRSLYLVNSHSRSISRIDLKTSKAEVDWVVLPEGAHGNGSTIGPDRALYITDSGQKSILKIDPKTRTVTTIADKNDVGTAFNGPNDLVFDAKGGLYFTDPKTYAKDATDGFVYYVAPKTHRVTQIAAGLAFPNGLALSKDGKTLFVAESVPHKVAVFALGPDGTAVPNSKTEWLIPGVTGDWNGPDGMRLGLDGNLYLAIFGNGVIDKVTPQGELLRQFPVPTGPNITNLCFARDHKSLYVTVPSTNSVVQVSISQ